MLWNFQPYKNNVMFLSKTYSGVRYLSLRHNVREGLKTFENQNLRDLCCPWCCKVSYVWIPCFLGWFFGRFPRLFVIDCFVKMYRQDRLDLSKKLVKHANVQKKNNYILHREFMKSWTIPYLYDIFIETNFSHQNVDRW